MTKLTRHLVACTCTALLSITLLAGAIGPAHTAGVPLASTARLVA